MQMIVAEGGSRPTDYFEAMTALTTAAPRTSDGRGLALWIACGSLGQRREKVMQGIMR
jgi:hypothetical protein